MATPLSDLIEQLFLTIEAKDIDAVMASFSPHAEFIDPHYPSIHMKGKEEIRKGLTWGFSSLKKLGFTRENYYKKPDGSGAAIEVATAHELSNGGKLNFPQVFIIDSNWTSPIRTSWSNIRVLNNP